MPIKHVFDRKKTDDNHLVGLHVFMSTSLYFETSILRNKISSP